VDGNDKKVIDSNGRIEEIKTISMATRAFGELLNKDKQSKESCVDSGIFTEGIKATVITQDLPENDMLLVQEQSNQIVSDAREQAANILEQASKEAEVTCQQLYQEAQSKGHEEGVQKGEAEVELVKRELDDLINNQNNDYQKQVEKLESQFADVISKLIEKITGIIVEDKKEVILYLIHNAMIKTDNSKSYVIKTSKEDYEYILSQKDELLSLVKGDISLDISFDSALNKNQCLIETDTRIIDCSLDVQLTNLVQDIKLLSIQKE
jgi:flagellar assembly protein FliH